MSKDKKKRRLSAELEWPYSLLAAIFMADSSAEAQAQFEQIQWPNDLIPSVDYVLSFRTSKELAILKARYQEKRTLASIGEEVGVTREYIRQKCERTLRKLRHPSATRILQAGVRGCINAHQEEIFRAGYDAGRKDATEPHPLSVLALSTRSENALERAGLRTVEDIQALDKQAFCHIAGLGQKSRGEVLAALVNARFFCDHLKEGQK